MALFPNPVYSSDKGTTVKNTSYTQQAIVAATRTVIIGSSLAIPAGGLKVGAKLRWVFNMAKTAAGTAASTFDIAFGLLGTTADTARVSFAKPAGTAVADEGRVVVEAVVRSVSATGVVIGEFTMVHNLAATGHATIPCVVVNTISAGFANNVADTIVSLCITSGASDAITIEYVEATLSNVA